MMHSEPIRREVRSRGSWWAHASARFLTQRGIKPNQVSLASIGCSGLFALFVLCSSCTDDAVSAALLIVLALAMILARLLCNLFDGMIAVEGGLKSKSGEVFNEVPDRFSDSAMFVGAAYAVTCVPWAPALGWLAALAALLTAYCRVLGGALGLKQRFTGPMAKQHRMAVLSAGLIATLIERAIHRTDYALLVALLVIAAGSFLTCAIRLHAVVVQLESAPERVPDSVATASMTASMTGSVPDKGAR